MSKYKLNPNANFNRTSLQGTLEASWPQLKAAFGEPLSKPANQPTL